MRYYTIILICFFCINFITFFHTQTVQAEFVPPEVETVIINEYNNPFKKSLTIQPTPVSVVNVLNFVDKSQNRQTKQLLKYVYPTYSDAQLNAVTTDLEQSNKYVLNQGYKTKITTGPIDNGLLKEELSNNRPVIAFLTANGSYWIEQETAIIIYGYQKVTFPGRPAQIVYMYQSVIHGNGAIYSGAEKTIPLLSKESQIDPTANVTFNWDSTLYGFKK